MSLSHLYRDGEGHLDDDDDERENFEITDWDLQNEFNPNRQRHWQTKEEATYGVWAERDSDEERPSFGGKRYCLLGCMPWRIQKASQKSFLPLSSPHATASCYVLLSRVAVLSSHRGWERGYVWIEKC